MSSGTYRGRPFTPEANALALRIGKLVAKARGTHTDKFLALVAVIKALGVADEMCTDMILDTGTRTNAPGQDVCELKR